MTSKVEELRDQVMANCGVGNPWYGDPIAMTVDSLISAAEMGERKRIIGESTFDGKHYIVPELVLQLSKEEYPSLEEYAGNSALGEKS